MTINTYKALKMNKTTMNDIDYDDAHIDDYDEKMEFVWYHSWWCQDCGRRYWKQNWTILERMFDSDFNTFRIKMVCPSGHTNEKYDWTLEGSFGD